MHLARMLAGALLCPRCIGGPALQARQRRMVVAVAGAPALLRDLQDPLASWDAAPSGATEWPGTALPP